MHLRANEAWQKTLGNDEFLPLCCHLTSGISILNCLLYYRLQHLTIKIDQRTKFASSSHIAACRWYRHDEASNLLLSNKRSTLCFHFFITQNYLFIIPSVLSQGMKLLYFGHSFATKFAGSCWVVSRRGKWKVALFSRTVSYLALCLPYNVETSHEDFFVNFTKPLP